MVQSNPGMPIMATNTGAVMIIIHFSALPFQPQVLNFSEKNLTGLIISQLSTSTMSRNQYHWHTNSVP